jgi:hypothetical protein
LSWILVRSLEELGFWFCSKGEDMDALWIEEELKVFSLESIVVFISPRGLEKMAEGFF